MKKLSRFLLCLAVVCMPLLSALPAQALTANEAPGFTVKNMVVTAELSQQNVLTVHEEFTIAFSADCAGFTRLLPAQYSLTRPIGEGEVTASVKPTITGVVANGTPAVCTQNDGYLSVPVANWGNGFEGERTYTLSYTYDIGADQNSSYDDIFYSFTSATLPEIEHLEISFTFPKRADFTDIRFFTGPFGALSAAAPAMQISNTKTDLTFTAQADMLSAGESLTMYLKLPEGYFAGARSVSNTPLFVSCGVLGALLVIALLLNRKKRPLPVMRPVPPKGLNPAEAGYIMNRMSTSTLVISLVFWLADEGHLTFAGSGKNLKLTSQKPLSEDAPAYLSGFYNTLFAGEQVLDFDAIERNLSTAAALLQNQLPAHFKAKRKLTNPFATLLALIIQLAAPLLGAFAIGYTGYNLNRFIWLFAALFTVFALLSSYAMRIAQHRKPGQSAVTRTGVGAGAAGLGAVALCMAYFAGTYSALAIWVPVAIGVLALLTGLLAAFTNLPTRYARTMRAELEGLHLFMSGLGSDGASLHTSEDADYCHHLLPYAYLFNMESKWAALFDGIRLPTPAYYTSDAPGATLRSIVDNVSSSFKGLLKSSTRRLKKDQRANSTMSMLNEILDEDSAEFDGALDENAAELYTENAPQNGDFAYDGEYTEVPLDGALPAGDLQAQEMGVSQSADAPQQAQASAPLSALYTNSGYAAPATNDGTDVPDLSEEDEYTKQGEDAYAAEAYEELPALETENEPGQALATAAEDNAETAQSTTIEAADETAAEMATENEFSTEPADEPVATDEPVQEDEPAKPETRESERADEIAEAAQNFAQSAKGLFGKLFGAASDAVDTADETISIGTAPVAQMPGDETPSQETPSGEPNGEEPADEDETADNENSDAAPEKDEE